MTSPTRLCVWKGVLYSISYAFVFHSESRAYSRQLVCTATLSAHTKVSFLWQVIYLCIKFNHKDSPSILLSVEPASRCVRQLVLELPPAAASLSAATTGPLGRLIYRTPLSEWISGSAAACSVVITVKSSLQRGVTMSHPLRSAWKASCVWRQGRCGCKETHKNPKRAEQTQ